MSSNLERRYRALLRVLPAWYRAEREEEMVGIFLAGRDGDLDPEYGWPGWGETFATLGLAVRVRFRAGGRAGDVARLVAMAGLVGHVVLIGQGTASMIRFGGVWALWFDALVVAAFVGLLTGRRLVARVAVSVAALYGLVGVVPLLLSGPPWWMVAVQVPTWVTAAAVWLGYHREAPSPPQARWLAAAVVGLVAGAVWAFLVPLSLREFAGAWLITTAVVVLFRPWAGARARVSTPAG